MIGRNVIELAMSVSAVVISASPIISHDSVAGKHEEIFATHFPSTHAFF